MKAPAAIRVLKLALAAKRIWEFPQNSEPPIFGNPHMGASCRRAFNQKDPRTRLKKPVSREHPGQTIVVPNPELRSILAYFQQILSSG